MTVSNKASQIHYIQFSPETFAHALSVQHLRNSQNRYIVEIADGLLNKYICGEIDRGYCSQATR